MNYANLIDQTLRSSEDLLDEGRRLARDCKLGTSLFLKEHNVSSEAVFKRLQAEKGHMMQHAHIGFRRLEKTTSSMKEIYDIALTEGFSVSRFGITLDWTMGYPPDRRDGAQKGTGIVLNDADDFARITDATPAAAHFGDFMLGLPGSLHNTKAAIAAGVTSIGNLGQYFTFRLPYWDDDVATTEATVTALGLIAAQNEEILVHSNLDDGFAGMFRDMSSALGMVMLEKHIVEDLIGANISFCYGHHFSDPLRRAAFHAALSQVTNTPGTMIFGNTVAYKDGPAANYASLANYLITDILSLSHMHTGHAINPVPVTENMRIPDVDEILDAQRFAARLIGHAPDHEKAIDRTPIEHVAKLIVEGGRLFTFRALKWLEEFGVNISDPAALMLAIRRLGARQMEQMFGASEPIVEADWARELDLMAKNWIKEKKEKSICLKGLRIALGTSDVHEHGAYLVHQVLEGMDAEVINVGVSIDAEDLVSKALETEANVIAVSSYNGIALNYTRRVLSELSKNEMHLPLIIGGKLNEISEDTNSELPRDVSKQIQGLGAHPCKDLDEMLLLLENLLREEHLKTSS